MKIEKMLFSFLLLVLSACAAPAQAPPTATGLPPSPTATLTPTATTTPSPTATPLPDAPPTYLSVGGLHACAVTEKGGLKCWGANFKGQLGSGRLTDRVLPVDVKGLTADVAAVAAGWYHTCALTKAGGVKCWGWNRYGEVGDGTTEQRLEPVDVLGLSGGVIALTAGFEHTCALTKQGGVKCWGDDQYGQLGTGNSANALRPADVAGLQSGVAAISAKGDHTCALTAGGQVMCWGYNGSGELGVGSRQSANRPTGVYLLPGGVVGIAAGENHTCALENGGGVKCWGNNQEFQLGAKKDSDAASASWVQMENAPEGIVKLSAGGKTTCALTAAGGVFCWGSNERGLLGTGTKEKSAMSPAAVSGLASGVRAISIGRFSACALKEDGIIKCWGGNFSGQLGNGTFVDRYTPSDVQGMTGWSLP